MAWSTRTIPPLRSDVALEHLESAERLPFAAVDRTLGQRVRLDQRGAMLASALDRPWQAATLLDVLAESGLRLSPELLVRFVRFLDAHYLLQGERSAKHIAAVHAADAQKTQPSAAITFLPGTSHNCVACGASCAGHDVGPIANEQVATIRERIPLARFLTRRTNDAATSGQYCAMESDACTFLRKDRLCSIHAQLGMASKPTDCRVFPLAFTSTPDGVLAGLRLECRSYLESKRNGGHLEARQEELAALLAEVGPINEVAPLVRLDGTLTVPWSDYVAFEATLMARPVESVVWSGLQSLNRTVAQWVQRTREDEQEAWVFPPDAPDPPRGDRQELVEALIRACTSAARMNAAAGNTLRAERLERVAAAAERLCEGSLPALRLDADENELLYDHLQQTLFLKDPLVGPHLRFGMGLLNLSVLLAVSGRELAGGLNAALADALKALRTGPVLGPLHEMDETVAYWLHDQLDTWLRN